MEVNRRLRLLHVLVQPVLVWDDGDSLTPGPDLPVAKITLDQAAEMPTRLPAEIAVYEASLVGPTDESKVTT